MEKAIIWGTGDIAKRLFTMKQEYKIIVYTDNNPEKWGKKNFLGKDVVPPKQIAEYEYDYIIIANIYAYKEIYLQLVKEFGVSENKIKNCSEYMTVNLAEYNCGDLGVQDSNINVLEGIKNGKVKLNNDLERIVFSEEKYIITKYLHYFEIYNKFFERYREKDIAILEIGVYKGGSLYMWKNYFGKKAKIVGIDINSQCKQYQSDQISIEIGSQADETFLKNVVRKHGPFDIIVDDGSHNCSDQLQSFRVLFELLKDGGTYLCEDVQTSYDEEWEGGYLKPDSFIERSKSLIDYIHAYHMKENEVSPNYYTKMVHGIHYYNNMVIIEKRESSRPITFVGNKNFFHIPMANQLSDCKTDMEGENK